MPYNSDKYAIINVNDSFRNFTFHNHVEIKHLTNYDIYFKIYKYIIKFINKSSISIGLNL